MVPPDAAPPHPIAAAIREAHALGHVVRLAVDARRNDVAVPRDVRAQWQSRLVLDLDPTTPLRLDVSATAVAADLTFRGCVVRCVLPYAAIHGVLDRTTGRGLFAGQRPPEQLPPGLTAEADLRCSFCLKTRHEVKCLVSCPDAYICEECVAITADLVEEQHPGLLATMRSHPTDVLVTMGQLIRALPARSHIDTYGHVAGIAREAARGDATRLREASRQLGDALAFEHAVALRAAIAPVDRQLADVLSEAAYRARMGEARQAIQLYEGLSGLSPADEVVVTLGRAYARLGARTLSPSELPAIEAEVDAIEPRLEALGLGPDLLRGLTNQLVHVRARILAVKRRERDAIALLGRHLQERPYDTEALAVLVEVADRIGDTASSSTGQARALAFAPRASAFERRLLGG